MQSRAKELLSDHLAGGFSSKTKSSLTKHCSFVSSWVERIFYLSPGQQCVVVKWKSWICINIDWYMWIVSASPRGSAVHVFVFILWMENGGYDTLLISSWGIKEFERQRWTQRLRGVLILTSSSEVLTRSSGSSQIQIWHQTRPPFHPPRKSFRCHLHTRG